MKQIPTTQVIFISLFRNVIGKFNGDGESL